MSRASEAYQRLKAEIEAKKRQEAREALSVDAQVRSAYREDVRRGRDGSRVRRVVR